MNKEEIIKLKAELFDELLPHLYITWGCVELRIWGRELRGIHPEIKYHNGLPIENDELIEKLNRFKYLKDKEEIKL